MADSAILRRSLTKGQRAAIVLEFKEMVDELREQAREREYAGKALDPGSGMFQGRIKEILAEKAGIGPTYMQYLMSVQRDAPDLFEQVKAGKISINKAYTTKKEREEGEGEEVVQILHYQIKLFSNKMPVSWKQLRIISRGKKRG